MSVEVCRGETVIIDADLAFMDTPDPLEAIPSWWVREYGNHSNIIADYTDPKGYNMSLFPGGGTGSDIVFTSPKNAVLGLPLVLECAIQEGIGSIAVDIVLIDCGEESLDLFSSFVDVTGALYSAVDKTDEDSFDVMRFRGGISTKEVLANITPARNPSYAYDPRTNVHYLAFKNTSTDETVLVRSWTGGRVFV